MGLKGRLRLLLDPRLMRDPEKRLRIEYEDQRRRCNRRRSFPLTADAFMSGLDPEKLEAIRTGDGVPTPGVHNKKYLDMEKWLNTNVQRVLDLGLDLQPPRRVLDLGSGAGYFLHVCKRLAHDVLGLDMFEPSVAWYGSMFELFGMRRIIWRIDPFVPLPDLGAPFDYVCAFMVCFNRHLQENAWKIEEWRYFLDDLWTRLNPGAIVWLELNPGINGAHYSPELQAWFESRGAIVDGKRLVWGLDATHYRALLRAAKEETFVMRKAAEARQSQRTPTSTT